MRPLHPASPAPPAVGLLRGLRAGALAVLCVLLPLAGHAFSQGHAPRWLVVVAAAVVAVPGAVFVTRRRLTDTQLFGAFAASQLAYHVAYALPGPAPRCPAGRARRRAGRGWSSTTPWRGRRRACSWRAICSPFCSPPGCSGSASNCSG
ncbi:hypothetical protein O1L60_41410 [Streptomyces diastatochromogenes]|nr:hypothetical protein [Streptomyces diastatochromogenes]